MDNFMKVQNSMLIFRLEQLGAKIHRVSDIICYVDFDIDSTVVKYMYHIDKNNKYFLERISPYNVAIDKFDNEEDVIKVIKVDIAKFKNAKNSNKFTRFIDTSKEFDDIVKSFENIYLHYNVSKYDLSDLDEHINAIKEKLEEISCKSEKICQK
ncbi:hypothetical protein FDF74_04490 [Clostridium niameyense]|uniref:Uncharacterized protein n=1 Tax=Clostridium niameyense TaxID=1622073 RepID=A0A6M0R8A5_9CLOT|nr:hypothetical protein [Clostridium niameyense]NEZ46473.1 hypothetical protein [Clostridium niameyense]